MTNFTMVNYISVILSIFKLHKKSIQYMKRNLSKLKDTREHSSLLISIGMEYLKIGNPKTASTYFVSGLEMVGNMYLEYHPDYPKIFKVIYENTDIIIYKKFHDNFAQRIKDDKRFKKRLSDM